MREIKFELRYDNGLPNKIVTLAELANGLDKENGEHLFTTARQFTGLKDKNDVEIYEGDITKYEKHDGYSLDSFIGEVMYSGIDLEIDGFDGGINLHEVDELYHSILSHIEVIGNIYQNPELLAN